MKYLFILFLLLGIQFSSQAQIVYSTEWKSDADAKIFVTEWKSEADLIVYKTDWKSESFRQ